MQQAFANPFGRLVPDKRCTFLTPASDIALLVELIVLAQVFNSRLDLVRCLASGVAGMLAIAYSLLLLSVEYPQIERFPWIHWLAPLKQVVSAVRQNVRSSDMIGRSGGEEFAVILPETPGQRAMQVEPGETQWGQLAA